MGSASRDSVQSETRTSTTASPVLVRYSTALAPAGRSSLARMAPAWIASAFIHVGLLCLFLVATVPMTAADLSRDVEVIETAIENDGPSQDNLINEDIGNDPSELLNFNVTRIESVSVPGKVDAAEAVGIKDAPESALTNVPPPPGIGTNEGQGGGLDANIPGKANLLGMQGGMGGILVPGGIGGRSGATRQQLIREGGGNEASEAAVARGLKWISVHQAPDGHWSLDGFTQHGRCRCRNEGSTTNDIAATAFGLLPLLGAGETHKNPKGIYSKNVERGLKYLISKQNQEGTFTGTMSGNSAMYAHGLATIALCEAYGLTGDPLLRGPAQRAINYIRSAQAENGGWRYSPRQAGDTSVVGWQVMALKSGQMGGLEVDDAKNPTFARTTKFLNMVQTTDGGGYGYERPGDATETRSAIGLLCRQYLGWGPRNPGIVAGVNRLKQKPPGSVKNVYYYYYATQVMHHVGGPSWESWNPAMRDLMVNTQDTGTTPKAEHERGSWSPVGDAWAREGGRLMSTSLTLLTLEVYYRHLPLYKRDLGGAKSLVN